MWCWLSLKIIDFIQSFSSILEAFLPHLLVHGHPCRFQNETWENRSQALGTWGARPAGLPHEAGGAGQTVSGAFPPERRPQLSPQGVAPSCQRAWGREEGKGCGPRAESGDLHSSSPLPGRALGLPFPALKPHGFGSLKNPSCVGGQGGEQWLAISNVLSITWIPDARPLLWWGQSGHGAEEHLFPLFY